MKSDLRITIPEPCHEKWNKMTPNEQGSFCSKCCKTVIDFSEQTIEQIKKKLLEKSDQKICGRFKNEQLTQPVTVSLQIEAFTFRKKIPTSRAFAIALFIVFGTSLFSCITPQGHTVGEISLNDSNENKRTETRTMNAIPDTTALEMPHLLGEPSIQTKEYDQADTVILHLKGLVEAVHEPEIENQMDTIPEMKMGKLKIEREE